MRDPPGFRDVRPRRARPSPSTEGCRCVASSGSSGVTPWSSPPLLPHRRRPHPDLVVNSSLRAPRMVFIKLYEFFAVSFERRRRVNWIIRPCAGKSGFTSSLRLAQPRRQCRHLVPDYFVYSSNSRRWHLLPRLLLCMRPPWRPSLLVPLGDGIWLCILPCTFGIGNTGVCPSSPMA